MVQKTLMAIGAHADDIELYVGGTLLKYMDQGYDVIYIMSTNNMSGSWKHPRPEGGWDVKWHPYDEMQPQRKREAAAAAKHFGTDVIHLDHPQRHYTNHDGQRVTVCYGAERPGCVDEARSTILTAHEDPEHVQRLAELILKHRPEAVFTHGPVMQDLEHTATCLLVSKAYRQAVAQGHGGSLLHWPDHTPDRPRSLFGRSALRWDTHVDVSKYWDKKLDSVRFHASVIPEPGNVEYPDWGPACGCDRAEVFTVVDWGQQPEYASALSHELVRNA